MHIFLSILCVLFLLPIFKAQAGEPIKFYLEPQSAFPSGVTSSQTLQKNWVDGHLQRWYLFQGVYWTPEENTLVWQHFVKKLVCGAETALYMGKDPSKEPESVCKKKEVLEVLEYKNAFFRVKRGNSQIRWVKDQEVEPEPHDLGYAYSSELTKLESLTGPARIRLAPHQRLEVLGYKNNLVELKWNGQKLKTHRNSLVTPLDFAQEIKTKNGKWVPVEEVRSNYISSTGKRYLIPSNPILKWKKDRAIIRSNHHFYLKPSYDTPPISFYSGTLPKIEKEKLFTWGRSKVKNHGLMYWRVPAPDQVAISHQIDEKLLFDRSIFDMASSPKNKDFLIASAKGVYKKVADSTWQKIPLFGEKDYPIAFAKSGRLIVGPYYSDDEGKSFHPYIQWHAVFEALDEKGLSADLVSLKKVRSLDAKGNLLSLEFVSQNREHKLEWNIDNDQWKLVH